MDDTGKDHTNETNRDRRKIRACRLVSSRKSVGNRLRRKTISYRSGLTVVVIGILHLAQAWGSYTLRMLFADMLVRFVAVFICTVVAHAQNATWLLNPGSGDFSTAANWAPAAVPTGTATFGVSNTTTITFSANNTSVGTLQFNAGAPTYNFTVNQLLTLTINGNGIVNDSSNLPRLDVEGFVPAAGAVLLADVSFSSGTAGNAAITTNVAGFTAFANTSTAGNAAITTNSAGFTAFANTSTAGNAAITTNSSGGTVFANASTAGNATITTNSDGITEFRDTSTGGSARFITNAGGIFDVSQLTSGGMTVGSIEGAGTYFLGSKTLTVGLNNLSTVVSGTIADGSIAGGVRGMLIKEGTGTLTLTGPNTYSGGTALNAGILAVNGDGNLGTGALSFNGGALEALSGITSAKTISIAGGGAVFLADGGTSSILSGSISGVGSFAKIGHGTLTLTGSNTYSGGTALDNGALIVAATNALGTGPVTVNDPTLLQIDPHVTITNAIAISNGGTLINGGTIQVSATAGGPAAVSSVGWNSCRDDRFGLRLCFL